LKPLKTALPLSANIAFLFSEQPFLDRIDAAARAGFAAVECQFPYEHAPKDIRAALDGAGIPMLSLNTAPGDRDGDFGLACDPARRAEFQASVHRSLDYAAALDVPMVHVLAGMVAPATEAEAEAEESYLLNMDWAAGEAAKAGRSILTEPLNTRDRPGYFMRRSDQAAHLIRQIGRPNFKLMFDVYHIQIMEGDITRRLERHFDIIGHVQIAAVPSRAEPDEGEINLAHVCAVLQRLGYKGHIGCEYKPRAGTEEGLGWRALIRDELI
jgi:2-dehydrotetronate isomerase